MELEAKNTVVGEKSLARAPIAGGKVDCSRWDIEGIAVPVENGELRGQTLEEG